MALAVAAATLQAGANGKQQVQAPEYDFKATALLNFARFVEWPARAFEKENSAFVIGIVGDDPFTKGELEKALKGKTVNNRPFKIEKANNPANLKGCHLVFIPSTEDGRLEDILDSFKGTPTLTVAEKKGSAGKGAAFNILIKDKKPFLELNNKVAEAAGLKVDPRLRDQCETVDP